MKEIKDGCGVSNSIAVGRGAVATHDYQIALSVDLGGDVGYVTVKTIMTPDEWPHVSAVFMRLAIDAEKWYSPSAVLEHVLAEREACAKVCADRAKAFQSLADAAGNPEERVNLNAGAWQISLLADAIRKRAPWLDTPVMSKSVCACGMSWETDMDQFGCWSCGAVEADPGMES